MVKVGGRKPVKMVSPGGRLSRPGLSVKIRQRTCKPILSCAVIPLGAALPRTLISDLPGGFGNCGEQPMKAPRTAKSPPERIGPIHNAAWLSANASLPIWSCSVWGLPCPRRYRRSGALLPHHFTLTAAPEFSQRQANPASRANSGIAFPGMPSRKRVAEAVSFCGTGRLCALKRTSRTLSGTLPLRSSDFPPPVDLVCARLPAATARSSCQWLVLTQSRKGR